jgi:hypothetical protein
MMMLMAMAGPTRKADVSIVLLARVLDGTGRRIQPADVLEIEFSAHELDSCGAMKFAANAERPATRLSAFEVISPMLVRDALWSIDDVGYNFRHDVTIGNHIATPQDSGHVELRYVVVLTDNTQSTLRFRLRLG